MSANKKRDGEVVKKDDDDDDKEEEVKIRVRTNRYIGMVRKREYKECGGGDGGRGEKHSVYYQSSRGPDKQRNPVIRPHSLRCCYSATDKTRLG